MFHNTKAKCDSGQLGVRVQCIVLTLAILPFRSLTVTGIPKIGKQSRSLPNAAWPH